MAHILLIDDDKQILSMLKYAFERDGYKVTTAINGKEGIKLYKETHADVIITDIVMPEMEGLAVIRKLHKENKNIKIIALSGGGFVNPEEYLKLATQFGAKYAFTKPANFEELLNVVKKLTE